MKRIGLYMVIFILVMGLGTGSVSAEETENKYQDKIQLLIDFEIIDGELEDIDAEDELMRETAALWIYNLMESEYETEKSDFTDVVAGTKTANAIMSLKEMGLVSGYGDGTFRPRNAITYEEYTKLLIDFLGYKSIASSTIWSKDGYADMASRLGLDEDVVSAADHELSVGEGAAILYNALQAEVMNTGKTALENYKHIYQIEGKIERNAYTGINDPNGAGRGYMTIAGQRYQNENSEYDRLLGQTVTAYCREDPDGDRIVNIEKKNNINELIVDAEMIMPEESNRESMVYEHGTSSRKTAKISASADIIYNEKADPDLDESYFYPDCGEVRLVDSDNNGIYDIVFITDYKLIFVSHASENPRTVYNQYTGDGFVPSITIDDDASVEVLDAFGEPMEFSDIQENTILLAAYSESGDQPYYKFLLADQSVNGTVQSVNNDSVTVDGQEIEFSEGFKKAVNNNVISAMQAGSEYTVYMDIFGEAAAYELTYAGEHYGYLERAYVEPGGEVYVKIFDDSGQWQTMTVKSKVLVDDIERSREAFLNYATAGNLVRYKVNSKMQLTSLENAVDVSGYTDDERLMTIEHDKFRKAVLNSTNNNNKYYSNNKSFSNSYFMDEDAIIFLIPTGDSVMEEDYAITDNSYLTSENRYELTVYDMDEYMFSKTYVMYYDTSSVAGLESILSHDDPCMIVQKVLQEAVNGEVVSVAYGLVNGQEWSYTSSDENTFEDVKKGDIIRTKYDDSSKLSKYIMVHRLGTEDTTTNVDDVNNAVYITGNVLSADYTNKRVRIREGKDLTIVIPDSVSITVYDKQSEEMRSGSLQDINQGDYLVFRMRSSVPKEIFIIKE